MVSKATSKRPYLAKPDRRAALLEVAAEIARAQGWSALTMISLAEGAKVSRQLVYQHFPSVNELIAQTLEHLFRGQYERIREHISNPDLSLVELVELAEKETFDAPPEQVRALWQMLTAADTGVDEVATVSRRLRHLLIKLWAPLIQQRTGCDESRSRALAWMMLMATWGAHQMVEDGELSRKTAVALSTELMLRLGQS